VGTQSWGGFSLTLLLTAGSGLLALPLGVLIALGRRSDLPVLRGGSTAYIELMRAIPLIAVLFFGQLLIPLSSRRELKSTES
jgi:general L-amino acid transport system permease protein